MSWVIIQNQTLERYTFKNATKYPCTINQRTRLERDQPVRDASTQTLMVTKKIQPKKLPTPQISDGVCFGERTVLLQIIFLLLMHSCEIYNKCYCH